MKTILKIQKIFLKILKKITVFLVLIFIFYIFLNSNLNITTQKTWLETQKSNPENQPKTLNQNKQFLQDQINILESQIKALQTQIKQKQDLLVPLLQQKQDLEKVREKILNFNSQISQKNREIKKINTQILNYRSSKKSYEKEQNILLNIQELNETKKRMREHHDYWKNNDWKSWDKWTPPGNDAEFYTSSKELDFDDDFGGNRFFFRRKKANYDGLIIDYSPQNWHRVEDKINAKMEKLINELSGFFGEIEGTTYNNWKPNSNKQIEYKEDLKKKIGVCDSKVSSESTRKISLEVQKSNLEEELKNSKKIEKKLLDNFLDPTSKINTLENEINLKKIERDQKSEQKTNILGKIKYINEFKNIKDSLWKNINNIFDLKKTNAKKEIETHEYIVLIGWKNDNNFSELFSEIGNELSVPTDFFSQKLNQEIIKNLKTQNFKGFFVFHNHPEQTKPNFDSVLSPSENDKKFFSWIKQKYFLNKKSLYFDSFIYKNDNEDMGLYSQFLKLKITWDKPNDSNPINTPSDKKTRDSLHFLWLLIFIPIILFIIFKKRNKGKTSNVTKNIKNNVSKESKYKEWYEKYHKR